MSVVKEPLVSVVIPTYNRAGVLSRAVLSVANQDYNNLEIIIVDDGSTDNTQELIRGFNDARIIYIRHPENKGVSAARNTGVKNSKGDFIAFLDSDDEYLPGKITKSLEVFKNSAEKFAVVSSNSYRVDGEKKCVAVSGEFPFLHFPVFSRKVFDAVGFLDEKLEVYEDLDFSTRVICNFPSYFINEPLSIYHFTKGSLSSSFSDIKRLIEIKKLVLDRYVSGLRKNRRKTAKGNLARINYYLGKDSLSTGQIQEARNYFLNAFFAYPFKVEYFGKFVKSCFMTKRQGKNEE